MVLHEGGWVAAGEGMLWAQQLSTFRSFVQPCGEAGWRKAGSTLRSSRAVPHPSTNRALRRLTSVVGSDPVHSTRYGCQQMVASFYTAEYGQVSLCVVGLGVWVFGACGFISTERSGAGVSVLGS